MTRTDELLAMAAKETDLLISDVDEKLLMSTLLSCYSTKPFTFRVSKEHYKYLAEHVVAQRVAHRRLRTAHTALCRELADAKRTLEQIADPIGAMIEAANKEGANLNGAAVIQLSNDPNYLKGIAKDALSPPRDEVKT
jgi:hypothetical protein